MKIQTKLLLAAASMLVLALGGSGGYYFAMRQMRASTIAPSVTPAAKPLYWYDPMVPAQHFDAPGKSPFMDMQLVPKYAAPEPETGAPSSIQIDPSTVQNLGIRTAVVEVSGAHQSLAQPAMTVPGILTLDQRAVSIEQARAAGFVERVFALAPGDVIRAGQPLAELIVPQWSSAQQEFLALRASGEPALVAAAHERLRLVGMPETAIQAVAKGGRVQRRFTIYSTRAGVIQELDVRAGMSVVAGQTLARINGIESLWCEISVPEALAAELKVGGGAAIQLSANPGRELVGAIDAILPALNAASRSVVVRITLDNADGLLRAGMAATVVLTSLTEIAQAGTLTVPTEAVIRTGKRALVMRVLGKGTFAPVEVKLGREIGERTVIIRGLNAGEMVVVSGQFLLDSEASLSGVGLHATADGTPPSTPPSSAVMPMGAPANSSLHEADATIVAIKSDSIKLAHGPFESLKMPGMTMSFGYSDVTALDTTKFKVGDAVHVWVREDASGLVVERLERSESTTTRMAEGQ